jgi:hypothetical protein
MYSQSNRIPSASIESRANLSPKWDQLILMSAYTPLLLQGATQEFTMLTAIAGALVVLCIGILIAHALDGFRS